MWEGDGQYRLATTLSVLISQLEAAYPSQGWQTSAGTGTIGDAAHLAEGAASDHNPWLDGTVRALDVTNEDPAGPDCEELFAMVNRMYAAHDERVFPYGYAIYRGRITDWDNPGGVHPTTGDPHDNHLHISVGQSRAGYDSIELWPIPGAIEAPEGSGQPIDDEGDVEVLAFAYGGATFVHDPAMTTVTRFDDSTAYAAYVDGLKAIGVKRKAWNPGDKMARRLVGRAK